MEINYYYLLMSLYLLADMEIGRCRDIITMLGAILNVEKEMDDITIFYYIFLAFRFN